MYAIIKAGGLQYKVNQGDEVVINKIEGKAGDKVTFDQVIFLGGEKAVVGLPLVQGAKVEAKIKSQQLGDKVTVFKYHRRKSYKKHSGHRQPMTTVEIVSIVG